MNRTIGEVRARLIGRGRRGRNYVGRHREPEPVPPIPPVEVPVEVPRSVGEATVAIYAKMPS